MTVRLLHPATPTGSPPTRESGPFQNAIDKALADAGKPVVALAQSVKASREVLREEAGFAHADTVARFLKDEQMQELGRGGVILIDEASQLGTREMLKVFDVAERVNARVLLVGDRRQHRSVTAGDPPARRRRDGEVFTRRTEREVDGLSDHAPEVDRLASRPRGRARRGRRVFFRAAWDLNNCSLCVIIHEGTLPFIRAIPRNGFSHYYSEP